MATYTAPRTALEAFRAAGPRGLTAKELCITAQLSVRMTQEVILLLSEMLLIYRVRFDLSRVQKTPGLNSPTSGNRGGHRAPAVYVIQPKYAEMVARREYFDDCPDYSPAGV
jgi:hypothetical protein